MVPHGKPDLSNPVGEAVGVVGSLGAHEGQDPGAAEAHLLQPVHHASADARVVDDERVDPLPVAVGLEKVRGLHGVASADSPGDPGDGSLPPDDNRLAVAVTGDVAGDDDGAGGLKAPVRCAVGVGEGDDHQVQVVREPAEDGAEVQWARFAPVLLAVGHVLPGDQARDDEVVEGDVGGVSRADLDSGVHLALGVVGVVEGARGHEGIAGHEQAGGVKPSDGVDVRLPDGVGLCEDDHQVGGVEALEVVGGVRGESQGEGLLVELVPRGAEHPPAEAVGGLRVGGPDLVPDDVVDLARGGAGHYGLRGRPGVDPPEYGPRGGPVLSGAVASDDGYASSASHGVQDIHLFVVGTLAEDFAHELDGAALRERGQAWVSVFRHMVWFIPTSIRAVRQRYKDRPSGSVPLSTSLEHMCAEVKRRGCARFTT